MQDYTRCFFEKSATITNISEQDVIGCYHQGLFDRFIFRDFDRQRPKTITELRVMMTKWDDNEEQENDRFPKRSDDNNGNKWANDNRGKGLREQPDSSRK